MSDAKDLKIEQGKLTGTRMVYGGKFAARISAPLPCIATVQSGSYQNDTGTSSSVETIAVSVPTARTTHLETEHTSKASANLSSAQIIVSVGTRLQNEGRSGDGGGFGEDYGRHGRMF